MGIERKGKTGYSRLYQCEICSKEFWRSKSAKTALFCSLPCYGLSRKNKKFSEEHRQKISVALQNRTFSKEHRQKISVALTGRKKNPVSEKTKQKLREKTLEFWNKKSEATEKRRKDLIQRNATCFNLGKKRGPMTRSQKIKISKTRKLKGLSSGEKNPNWKGGLTKIQISIRNSDEYKRWRKQVYSRDSYCCIICQTKGNGKNLQADHIIPLSVILKINNIKDKESSLKCALLWDISNGRTLCLDCHKKTDSYGWKATNNYIRKLEKGGPVA